MRPLLTLLVAIVTPVFLFAQKDKDIPSFGKVDKEELLLKDCDFDKNAEAMVLIDYEEMYCMEHPQGVRTEIERRVRIKILNDKGLDKADVKIPYIHYRNTSTVKNLVAQTYNLDEAGNIVITKLDKKNVFEKKVDARRSQVIFTMPEIKAGSVFEYKYKIDASGLYGASERHFQRDIPVAFSRFVINFPEQVEVYCERSAVLPIEYKNEKKTGREIQSYSMRQIPALRDEPYITCESDYVQKVSPQILAVNIPGRRIPLTYTWPQLVKIMMDDEDFGVQLKRNIPRTKDLEDSLKNVTNEFQKMKIIHSYVKKHMQWNGYTSIWALDGVKAAWNAKKGTTGEINLILVNLLKDAGLKAHPILVSTKSNGRVNTGNADYTQFDKVLAHVNIGERAYILDGTDHYTPSSQIPLEVMYSEGLVIEKPETYEWGWTSLWDEKQLIKDVVVLTAELSTDGQLKGAATITSYDYSRTKRLEQLKKGRSEFLKEVYLAKLTGISADSMQIQNDDHDSLPLIQTIPFVQKLNAAGEYQYFNLNLFTGFESNPFVADTRFSDVFYSANQHYTFVGSVTIPEGYTFEELPKSMRMITPDTSISLVRRVATTSNQLVSRISVDFKKPFFSVEEYEYFKEFYKKMVAVLNEQYVIRKKASPKP